MPAKPKQIEAAFWGIVKIDQNVRSQKDGRTFVSRAILAYNYRGYEWRTSQELPKYSDRNAHEIAAPRTITRTDPTP